MGKEQLVVNSTFLSNSWNHTVTIWELYIHDNLSFKSLHLNGWEKYKEFLMSSWADKCVSKKSCNLQSNYASKQSLHY